MSACLIGLGSNLGDRGALLETAVRELGRTEGIRVAGRSRWRQTLPIGGPAGQQAFLNGAVLVETDLTPPAVLNVLREIERNSGRQRLQRWGARTLALDLLLFDDLVLESPELTIPHPRMAWRRFVLEPAAEIAPTLRHPATGWTLARLLEHLNTAAAYVAITGPIGVGKTCLAEQLAEAAEARRIMDPLDLGGLESFYRDPSGSGWESELEFLQRRAEMLAADRPGWSDQLAVSDFWFDQSMAFASVWLSSNQLGAFRQRWESARQRVVKPKLIVLLDAPVEELRRRIRDRGRPGEVDLPLAILDQIRRALQTEISRPDQGPVLPLLGGDSRRQVAEVLAAVESM